MDNVTSSIPIVINSEDKDKTTTQNVDIELNHIDVHSIDQPNESKQQDKNVNVESVQNVGAVNSVENNDTERSGIEVSEVFSFACI